MEFAGIVLGENMEGECTNCKMLERFNSVLAEQVIYLRERLVESENKEIKLMKEFIYKERIEEDTKDYNAIPGFEPLRSKISRLHKKSLKRRKEIESEINSAEQNT